MKKTTALILVLCTVFTLCACGSRAKSEEELKAELKQEILEEIREGESAGETPDKDAAGLPDAGGIRPEVKEFLDSYEAFMFEYADFIEKYTSAGPENIMGIMGDYTEMLKRYAEFSEKIDEFDTDDLNSAELAYYLDVTNRVQQRLLSVS